MKLTQNVAASEVICKPTDDWRHCFIVRFPEMRGNLSEVTITIRIAMFVSYIGDPETPIGFSRRNSWGW